MDKLGKFVSHPLVVLFTYILTFIGVILALSNNIVLQIISVGMISICLVTSTIVFACFKCNVKKEKEQITESVKKTYYNQANGGIEKALELVQSIVNNSLSMKQNKFSEDHFKSVCQNICSTVRSALLNISNIDFSVCIKQIITDELVDINYAEASTQTIARSGHRIYERSQNDSLPQKISDNTSFLEILENNRVIGWASPNLNETVKSYKAAGKEYKNPDTNYSDYYNSTLVVPIRICSDYISPKILKYTNNTQLYNCIAFLCVDSPKEFDAEDVAFKVIAYKTLIACGNALYPFFENKLINEIENI